MFDIHISAVVPVIGLLAVVVYVTACVSSFSQKSRKNPAEGKYEILLLEIGNSVSTVYEVY